MPMPMPMPMPSPKSTTLSLAATPHGWMERTGDAVLPWLLGVLDGGESPWDAGGVTGRDDDRCALERTDARDVGVDAWDA